MTLRHILPVFFGTLLINACGHSLPELPGFDAAAWRRDPYACTDQRRNQLPALQQHRELLYGTRADAIGALFGRPDEEELSEQTEKTYFYYLEPGSQCAPSHQRSTANKLILRFGPLGTVTEILYERPAIMQPPADATPSAK
ncbi:hypothetical protein [Hymenobacter elongatus]|uniref:Uncharacterized protein n=1 Tax=Hymenobacter elongatus TaxID=877208 RepID=A0A4Z0PJ94_9BACT|nr:hypothetical protein [Hymenobacter elongatus]TGE14400.1 hypothetical protein E5J99_16255 [Hymenobacter elongatus]